MGSNARTCLTLIPLLAIGPLIALLGMIAVAETLRRCRNAALAVGETFALFWPTALAMAPTAAFVIAGYRNMDGFTIGHLTPFAASRTIGGIANLEMATFGLDPSSLPQVVFALVVLPFANPPGPVRTEAITVELLLVAMLPKSSSSTTDRVPKA